MLFASNKIAIAIFAFFVAFVLFLSFYLGRKAKSAKGYYAAHGQIGWFVNGVAFAGDYLSAASFLGICGLIAFYGYDGFLYSIGYLAGWIVALFVIAEPIKRLGKFTFADALDSRFNSRGIKLAVAISTLVVSIFYLIPQMVGAGALVVPLLGLKYWHGVVLVGITVTLIVVTAGMVSTTWVQFIKGSLLVIFCFILTLMILNRGLSAKPTTARDNAAYATAAEAVTAGKGKWLPASGPWAPNAKLAYHYERFESGDGSVATFRVDNKTGAAALTQTLNTPKAGDARPVMVNGRPQEREKNDLQFVGTIASLPDGKTETGPLGPLSFLSTLQNSTIVTWPKETIKEADGSATDVYYPQPVAGSKLLTPGGYFKGIKSNKFSDKLDFLSLMLALFCGTASLPHILIRYYTVKDQASARKSTIVGIAAIGFFYVLTLYLGLGAMSSGAMDPTNNNLAAPLLARSFSNPLFAIISAIAFTTVLGTVSGLILAGSGAVAHDLIENFLQVKMDDQKKVFFGKMAAAGLGVVAVLLGIQFEKLNAAILVGWAFNIAASANLPALVMLLFWKKTTKQGITAAVLIGMLASLGWILLSAQCYKEVYHVDATRSIIPFSNPAILTIPLGFIVLVVVSLMTQGKRTPQAEYVAAGR